MCGKLLAQGMWHPSVGEGKEKRAATVDSTRANTEGNWWQQLSLVGNSERKQLWRPPRMGLLLWGSGNRALPGPAGEVEWELDLAEGAERVWWGANGKLLGACQNGVTEAAWKYEARILMQPPGQPGLAEKPKKQFSGYLAGPLCGCGNLAPLGGDLSPSWNQSFQPKQHFTSCFNRDLPRGWRARAVESNGPCNSNPSHRVWCIYSGTMTDVYSMLPAHQVLSIMSVGPHGNLVEWTSVETEHREGEWLAQGHRARNSRTWVQAQIRVILGWALPNCTVSLQLSPFPSTWASMSSPVKWEWQLYLLHGDKHINGDSLIKWFFCGVWHMTSFGQTVPLSSLLHHHHHYYW